MTNTEQSTGTTEAAPADPQGSTRAPPHTATGYRRWQFALFLASVWLVHFVVQFDKPVHIDDTHYVYGARHLLVEPWCPLCNVINWTRSPVPAYRDLINPPVYMYLQAGWIALFGDSIRGLHVLATLMVALAAGCGVLVAKRFTRYPMLATALVLLSPNVLPIVNLMVDIPTLAVSLASVAVFLRAVDHDRPPLAATAGVLAGLALLTKYNAVVIVPVLAVYAVLRGRARYLRFLAIPVGMLGLWCLHNLIVYGELLLLVAAKFEPFEMTPQRWWESFYSAALVPGSTFIFFGLLTLTRLRIRGFSILLPLGAVLLFGPAQFWWWTFYNARFEYWLFAINSTLLVMFAAGAPKEAQESRPRSRRPGLAGLLALSRKETISETEGKRRDELFLWLWIGGVTLFQLLFAHHQAPRYHILALPAFAILLVRALEAAAPSWRLRYLGWASVALELVVALFIAAADDAHARANDDFPAYVAREYGTDGGRIFCIGHWGLQYSCEAQGFTTFDAIHGDVREGDLIIVSENNYRANLPQAFQPLPAGMPICSPGSMLELVQDLRYPQDRTAPAYSSAEAFFGTRLLGMLHRAWPVSAMEPSNNAFMYAPRLPFLPYAWRSAQARTHFDERFLLLRARCDQAISTEQYSIDFGSYADRLPTQSSSTPTTSTRLISGWGRPIRVDGGFGAWSIASSSRLKVVLDHRRRDYILRASGKSVHRPDGYPVRVDVEVNGHPVGELVFTPEWSIKQLIVPAETLAEWDNEIVFTYSDMVRTIDGQPKAVLFVDIELSPLTPEADDSSHP